MNNKTDFDIKYTKQAFKTLKGYDKRTRDFIRDKIYGLTEIPPKGDIKPMEGSGTELRLRTGKYRVIFEYFNDRRPKVLMINKIDARGGVYK